MKFKKSKLIYLSILSFGTVGLVLAAGNSQSAQSKTSDYWYDNTTNSKFEVRSQTIMNLMSNDEKPIQIPFNNNFELKLLLNPGLETDDENIITEFNENFIKK
ncbi:hypothetical protein CO229_00510 [Mycoplasmopsis bovirhinis]|uniref:hypothetical protein n=1 Tax=Mycoplasmopsis bovirhinis TaxID=29553 RepID=UPI000C05C36B|nr:hypothetical protein [Mycoplasmopsis bovirhinis]ATO30612.1 hypothetical protein CO229_00510 [Mycoplasmopsis bovirhinis]